MRLWLTTSETERSERTAVGVMLADDRLENEDVVKNVLWKAYVALRLAAHAAAELRVDE